MSEPLLAADGLYRSYRTRGAEHVAAVRGVSLQLDGGESLAIIGRSGSGKSTLARLLLAIEDPDRGSVTFKGQKISNQPAGRVRHLRRHFQAVFQDPGASLDPCLRVGTIVSEPLTAHGVGSAADRRRRVREVLGEVGLGKRAELKYPDQFSGGERQRIAIARALAPKPELLILDEPLSSLDASVQREMIRLLGGLKHNYDLAMVMISHDLAIVEDLCRRVAIMHEGAIVETGLTGEILSNPSHPATIQLVNAARHPRSES